MAVDVNKNSYTFIFATVMVVVVGVTLAVAAISLKPRQDKNVEVEKKQDILSTIGFKKSETKPAEAEALFEQYITQKLVVLADGSIDSEADAFNIDMAVELKKNKEDARFPLYIASKDNNTFYIVPLRGNGLWGPIWGYIALKEDLNTILGASFDHKTETPGLGADINKDFFMSRFNGKTIYEADQFVSIQVVKNGASGNHQVDGISGGTITSVGVQNMLQNCISFYLPYFESLKMQSEAPEQVEETVADEVAQAEIVE
jgi:Na+-transporting NADH:ubiquinone oxidoreductase subunit C